jgi:Flp pilus assembly protein TadG
MSIYSRPRRCQSSVPRKSRRGAIVVLVAFSLVVILAFVAIAIDGGGLLDMRRQSQATADAAALAAAENLFVNYPTYKGADVTGSAADKARAIAAQNGFNNDGTQSVVTVRTTPQTYLDGPNKGTSIKHGYVEVTVQYNQPRYFSAVLGSGAIPVTARAVARGKWEPSFIGIHVLDLHAPSALRATGGGAAGVSGGAAIIVNSDAPDAAAVTTGGSTLVGSTFDITGGISGGGFYGEINLGTPPQPDPLRNIPEPVMSDYTDQSFGKKQLSNGTWTLLPGVYHGGISIAGQANVTMLPGIYYMDGGGFSMTGQGNLLANGVMIYNDPKQPSDVINISGSNGGSVTMTPPTSGIYTGLTLFQRRSATQDLTVSGNGSMYITGTFYAAGALMNVTGNGAGQIGSQYISNLLDINGGGALNIDYNPNQAIPVRTWNLVE